MSFDEDWDLIWLGPTQAEVDRACNKVTSDDLAQWRARNHNYTMSDTTVRAMLVIEACKRRPAASKEE